MRTLQGIVGLAAVAALILIEGSAPAALWKSPAGREALLLPASLPPAEAGRFASRAPVASVLGISLGMSEERAHGVLGRIGRVAGQGGVAGSEEQNDGLERELWVLDHRRYAAILLAFDEGKTLHSFQAYLRPRGLRYRAIGDLSRAHRLDSTTWRWEVRPDNGLPGRRVIAHGVDAHYAGSVAITRLP